MSVPSSPFPGDPSRTTWTQYLRFLLVGGGTVVLGGLCARLGLLGPLLLVALVGGGVVCSIIFRWPRLGFWSVVVMSIIALGIKRMVPTLPLGLSVDVLLVLTWAGLLLPTAGRLNWEKANRLPVWAALIWMGYVALQLLNPEAASRLAWAYAMRGVGLYFFLTIPLIFLLMDRRRDLDWFLLIWFGLSILGSLNGLRQKHLGLLPFEWGWLRSGAAETHILFGKLRIFSFLSDAGQFGGAQGHVAVVAGIMALGTNFSWKRRAFYATTSVLGLVGMFIAGTRGAIAVPAVGGATYLFLSRNWRTIALSSVVLVGTYILLMHTSIGNNIYSVQRFRSALQKGLDVPSMQVRLRNQKRLARYLSDDPVRFAVGGGIGSAGSFGRRFSPNTWLAQFPPDSWYVRLWATTGTIGLTLYLGLWLAMMGYGAVLVFRVRDPTLRQALSGLHAGIMGIMVASYANPVLGQIPTSILTYTSLGYLFLAPDLDGANTPFPASLNRDSASRVQANSGRPIA